MRKQNPVFWLCLGGTALLSAGIILLPRYLSRSLDEAKLNQVTASDREDFSMPETGEKGPAECFFALRQLEPDGENLTLIASFEQAELMSDELPKQVYEQAVEASYYGLLPWTGTYSYGDDFLMSLGFEPPAHSDDWSDQFRLARYYSLSYAPEGSAEQTGTLSLWYLCFTDGELFEYDFLVNASTYQIYYARIQNDITDALVDLYEASSDTSGTDAETDAASADADLYTEYDYYMQDMFLNGCIVCYEPFSAGVFGYGSLGSKMALAVLRYESETDDKTASKTEVYDAYDAYDAGEEAVQEGILGEKAVRGNIFDTFYIEQLPAEDTETGMSGITVGLQGLSDKLQNIIKE